MANINISDIEDLLADPTRYNSPRDPGVSTGGESYDQYYRPGTFLRPDTLEAYATKTLNEAYRLMGAGSKDNLLQNFLSRLDRHGTVITPLNTLNYGYTFITRPRLNLTSINLRQNPIMATLLNEDYNSIPFMIRSLLDTRLGRGIELFKGMNPGLTMKTAETTKFGEGVLRSGLCDIFNPFLIPVQNGLKGISGFPDFTLETETTEGDFHSGDFTFAKGSDMMNRTQELSLEFRDVQGSVILSIMFYWLMTIALQAKGIMLPYADDIYEQRLNYTVSIYRFVMDPTRKNILWWAKATGCFPKSAPIGALFNVNSDEVILSSAMHFSIPFTANDVKVNDPGALLDFNALMRRYTADTITGPSFTNAPSGSRYNFIGLPYIETGSSGLELNWKTSSSYEDVLGTNEDSWESLREAALAAKQSQYETMISQLTPTQENVNV